MGGNVYLARASRLYFLLTVLVGVLFIGKLSASENIAIGYRDFSYPPKTGQNSRPTGEKPESKLWFNDGAWWCESDTSHRGGRRRAP
jgi:hypothetical protein